VCLCFISFQTPIKTPYWGFFSYLVLPSQVDGPCPLCRIQARCERAAKANGDALVAPAHTRRHRAEEEEVQQELAYNKGANYDEDDMDEDYVAEKEGESEEVEMEPKDEEQELL
jgi:hypothetical protein